MVKSLEHNKIVIDETTLKEFFDLYFKDVCTFLNYYTHDQFLIEDIIQDIFIKLWEDRENVNIFFIKTYLYNAARNRMLNHLRDEQNRSVLIEEWANREIEKQKSEDCVNMEEFSLVYQQAIKDLPPKCQEIFLLSRELNKTYKEIAEEKDLSVKTVEAQMSIAIKKTREYILKHYNRPNSALPLLTTLILHHGYMFLGK